MPGPSEVDIVLASAGQVDDVRSLWREYWDSIGLAGHFQGFAEELKALPGVYVPPDGRLLLALVEGKPAGTAALRRLNQDSCEAKRLYVRPSFRGRSVGKALLFRLVEEARLAGYRDMYGDTLMSMTSALAMYRRMGFSEVAAYSPNPTPGAVFLRLPL